MNNESQYPQTEKFLKVRDFYDRQVEWLTGVIADQKLTIVDIAGNRVLPHRIVAQSLGIDIDKLIDEQLHSRSQIRDRMSTIDPVDLVHLERAAFNEMQEIAAIASTAANGPVAVYLYGIDAWRAVCAERGWGSDVLYRGWADYENQAVSVCAAQMARVCAPAVNPTVYLELVAQILLYEIQFEPQHPDPTERRRRAYDALGDLSPAGMTFMFRLHAAAQPHDPAVTGSDDWAREAFGPQIEDVGPQIEGA